MFLWCYNTRILRSTRSVLASYAGALTAASHRRPAKMLEGFGTEWRHYRGKLRTRRPHSFRLEEASLDLHPRSVEYQPSRWSSKDGVECGSPVFSSGKIGP